MKLIPILLLVIAIVSAGCANQQIAGDRAAQVRNFVQNIEPSLRPAAYAATNLYISLAVKTQDRAAVIADIHKVAAIVAAISPNQTPGQLSKAIQGVLPANEQSKNLADAIAGGVGIAIPFAKDDTALFAKVVSDLGGGVADATTNG